MLFPLTSSPQPSESSLDSLQNQTNSMLGVIAVGHSGGLRGSVADFAQGPAIREP